MGGGDAFMTQPTRDREGPFLRRLGDVIQGLAVLAIVALAGAVINMGFALTKLQTQFDGFQEVSNVQTENMKLTMSTQAAIIERVTSGGFNAAQGEELAKRIERQGRELSDRVGRNDDRLERLGRELAVAVARLDGQIKQLEKDISRTEVGKMKGVEE